MSFIDRTIASLSVSQVLINSQIFAKCSRLSCIFSNHVHLLSYKTLSRNSLIDVSKCKIKNNKQRDFFRSSIRSMNTKNNILHVKIFLDVLLQQVDLQFLLVPILLLLFALENSQNSGKSRKNAEKFVFFQVTMSHCCVDHKLDGKFMFVVHYMLIYSELCKRHEQLGTKIFTKNPKNTSTNSDRSQKMYFFSSLFFT